MSEVVLGGIWCLRWYWVVYESEVVLDGLRWFWVVSGGIGWSDVVLGGLRLYWVV